MASCENPENGADALMPRTRKYDKSKICVKCKERHGNIVARHTVYCRECFISFFTFKFRRALEPYVNAKPDGPRRKALKPTGNLLIGYSGGIGSAVLMDLVYRHYVHPDSTIVTSEGGKAHPRNERVWEKITVCYVEVSDALPGTKDRTTEIQNVIDQMDGVEFLPIRLQDAFDFAWWNKRGFCPSDPTLGADFSDELLQVQATLTPDIPPLTALRLYLASLPTASALPTAVQTLVRLLLQYTAISMNCSHLLLGTSLTSLAISLIAGISQGGGFHVREEAQEEWLPNCLDTGRAVRIIRPLREIGMKECGVWAWWMHLPIVGREKWHWPGTKPGIGRLTKDFIIGLEKDYPSTVSTIVRTCGKLAPKGDTAGKCVICERPVQTGVQEWKARIAIRASQDEQATWANSSTMTPSLAPYLCYVCLTTFTSKGARAPPPLYSDDSDLGHGLSPLPTWTTSSRLFRAHGTLTVTEDITPDEDEFTVARKLPRSEMRDVVKEFLLDE
ncbi:hypothetical protein BDY19DRAFT_1033438 [Irpex rosettiformis]|uniref:Uncharacterized protein n=1 Tax=Irpex rosettiformis TaxID=378272 RepID=A0ACB8UA89_9APHY|nr:hypothetical protein BDY19DRAFT_1033438 [Irpex rosettiformis]